MSSTTNVPAQRFGEPAPARYWMPLRRPGVRHHLITTPAPGATGNRSQFTLCGRFIAPLPFAVTHLQQGCYVSGPEVEALDSRACTVCRSVARHGSGAAA